EHSPRMLLAQLCTKNVTDDHRPNGRAPWAVDRGLWTVDCGLWAENVGRGSWTVGCGPWAVDGGSWIVGRHSNAVGGRQRLSVDDFAFALIHVHLWPIEVCSRQSAVGSREPATD